MSRIFISYKRVDKDKFPVEEQTVMKRLTASHPAYKTKIIESYTSTNRFILNKKHIK